jgi:Flp pilus assembly protein TadG
MLKRFIRDRRANIAVLFALSLVPVIAVVGAAVDYSRWSGARQAAQAVLDSTAISTAPDSRDQSAMRLAEAALRERLSKITHAPVITDIDLFRVNPDHETVSIVDVSVRGHVPTTFMRFFGIAEMPLNLEARSRANQPHFEVSLVLDVTGSMRVRGRIEALREAARNAVDVLLPASTPPSDRMLINIVPYVTAVNIGRHRSNWLAGLDAPPHNHPRGTAIFNNRYIWTEDEVPEAYCRGSGVTWDSSLRTCHLGQRDIWSRPGPCPGVRIGGICYVADGWAGCVEERGRGVHELSDGTPAMAPFSPYYWPSWGGVGNPDAEEMHNSYLPVPIDETREMNALGPGGRGPNLGCPRNEIIDWTNDRDLLLATIEDLAPWGRSGTMGHAGMAWGWRTLSPQWAGMWGSTPAPRPYDPDEVEKIVIFMTDGINQFFSVLAPPDDSDYTALGSYSDNPGVDEVNDQGFLDGKKLELCSRMKGLGIEIFTIGFDLMHHTEGVQARRTLERCATSPRHFYDTDTASIQGAFDEIARIIRARQQRLTN